MRTKENENETRTRSYAIAGIVAIAFALIAAIMVVPAAAFEPGECDIYVYDGQSIDAAVNSATDGQTVCVYNGTYGGRIDFEGDPNITLKGEGADVVTWDGGSEDKIVIGDNAAETSGTILEGFTIKGAVACQDLVKPCAPDCIIRNCVFDGLTGTSNIWISACNTTFENNVVDSPKGVQNIAGSNCIFRDNVVINATAEWGAIYIKGNNCTFANNSIIDNKCTSATSSRAICIKEASNCTIVNNTITGNNGDGIRIWKTSAANNIIKNNNISGNTRCGICLKDAGEGNEIYLNDIADNPTSVIYSGTPPTVTYWNSTEQIAYTYNPTYTNYLGNYWGSDYTGTDADGDGIGDTAYPIPGSPTDNDYRPLMEPFENYPEATGPTPSNDVYLEPATSSASFCQETTVQVYANTSDEFQGGQFNLTYDANCANVTDVEFNTAVRDNNTWHSAEDGSEWITFRRDLPMVSGTQLIANLTIHCCNETELCETELHFMSDAEATAAGHSRYSALFNDSGVELVTEWTDGTFNCTEAVAVEGDANGDKVVNVDDVNMLQNYVGYPGGYTVDAWAADVTGDGVINEGDVILLANYVRYPGQYELKCV